MASNRLKEFVDYHINGDCECNGMVLKRYSELHQLNRQDKTDLCFFYTLTYCVASALLLLEKRKQLRSGSCIEKIKEMLVFQSDRKYMRMGDKFEKSIQLWKSTFDKRANIISKNMVSDGKLRSGITKYCEGWYGFGRFAAYLFIETYCALFGITQPINTTEKAQFKEGNVYTAGIFNVFCEDAIADSIDKYGITSEELPKAQSYLERILREIYKQGGDTNFFCVETTLCAYRKHFKGTRYNGYYADRQLSEITAFEARGLTSLAKELKQIRAQVLPNNMLGEKHGWDGIRTELKKRYLLTREIYKG